MNSHASAVLPAPHRKSTDDANTCDREESSGCLSETETSSLYVEMVDDLFTFSVFNPGFSGSMRGISVVVQLVPMQQSTVKVNSQRFIVTLYTYFIYSI